MKDGNDDLGDRMKMYELAEAGRKTMPLLPVLIRLDGRGFSKFTRGLERPFSPNFHQLMFQVTASILEEVDALIGYTQSDEMSFVLYSDNIKSQLIFDGRLQKLVSTLSAVASVRFNRMCPEYLGAHKAAMEPTFDCRVWTVPTKEEAANAILWRERDATKNAVSMAARAHFTHKELQNKDSKQMQAMLLTKDINFNCYPAWFRRGTFLRKVTVAERPDEALAMKLQNAGRAVPDIITRSKIVNVDVPPFGTVINRVGFIFDRDPPMTDLPL